MKNRFKRIFATFCAAVLLCAVSGWAAADGTPATPTDLGPAEEEVKPEQPATEPEEPATEPEKEAAEEEPVSSEEIVVTKALAINQSWEGKMGKTKPAILKLDLNRACPVYMLVEGKDVWVTVEKADRVTDNPPRVQTDPETGSLLYRWEAEAGSYLITLGPVEPNLLAMAKVTFMDTKAYEAWEAEQEQNEAEPEEATEPEEEKPEEEQPEEEQPEEEPVNEPEEEKPEEEPVNEPEEEKPEEEPAEDEPEGQSEGEPEEEAGEEQPEENEPESENAQRVPDSGEGRNVKVSLTWDVKYPLIGDTAHLNAELSGYEGYEYTLQWQSSPDRESWNDIQDATDLSLDVLITEENNHHYWRLVVYLEEEPEG